MLAAVIVLAIVVLGLLAVLASVATRRKAAEARVAELEGRVAELDDALTTQTERADGAEADAAQVRTELAATTSRATTAEQKLRETTERAERAERQGTELSARIEVHERDLAAAVQREAELRGELATAAERHAELQAAVEAAAAEQADLQRELDERRAAIADLEAALDAAARFDAQGWWVLESRRADRLWHDRVALPFDPSPMVPPGTSRDEHLRQAVRVFTETSREESGVVIDLVWDVGRELPPDLCVAVLRLAEELVSVARASDGGELAVTRDGERLVVRLTTDPAVPAPDDLAAAVGRFGWEVADQDGIVAVTIPLPPPAGT